MDAHPRALTMHATPLSAHITTRAIRGKEIYEAVYDGLKQVSLYLVENINSSQEIKTHLDSVTVTPGDIQGWGGLAEMMQELIDHHISPGLKQFRGL